MTRVAFVLIALLASPSLAEGPPLLVGASNANYSTSVELAATESMTEPETVNFSKCLVGPSGSKVTIIPGGGDVVRWLDASECLAGEFFLMTLPDPSVTAKTIIRYIGNGEASSYTIGPVGAISGSLVARNGLLASDDDEGAWLNIFPESDNTPLQITLFDATSAQRAPVKEYLSASRPVTQYRIKARGVFHAEVKLGNGLGLPEPYNCWYYDPTTSTWIGKECSEYGKVYGFWATGYPVGSPRIREFAID